MFDGLELIKKDKVEEINKRKLNINFKYIFILIKIYMPKDKKFLNVFNFPFFFLLYKI